MAQHDENVFPSLFRYGFHFSAVEIMSKALTRKCIHQPNCQSTSRKRKKVVKIFTNPVSMEMFYEELKP